MEQPPAEAPDPRAELRRRWLAHAAAAFDLMFHPDHQADLVSFDQREARALELGGDLTAGITVESARAAANPAMEIRLMGDSVPPATMTSASPSAISRPASPIACEPVEQAVTTA